jgi:hypothetical protein
MSSDGGSKIVDQANEEMNALEQMDQMDTLDRMGALGPSGIVFAISNLPECKVYSGISGSVFNSAGVYVRKDYKIYVYSSSYPSGISLDSFLKDIEKARYIRFTCSPNLLMDYIMHYIVPQKYCSEEAFIKCLFGVHAKGEVLGDVATILRLGEEVGIKMKKREEALTSSTLMKVSSTDSISLWLKRYGHSTETTIDCLANADMPFFEYAGEYTSSNVISDDVGVIRIIAKFADILSTDSEFREIMGDRINSRKKKEENFMQMLQAVVKTNNSDQLLYLLRLTKII